MDDVLGILGDTAKGYVKGHSEALLSKEFGNDFAGLSLDPGVDLSGGNDGYTDVPAGSGTVEGFSQQNKIIIGAGVGLLFLGLLMVAVMGSK